MDFMMTNEKGEETSFLRIPYDMDIDIGNTNDYVLNVSLSEWQAAGYKTGCRFFVPGTEYGGIIQNTIWTSTSETPTTMCSTSPCLSGKLPDIRRAAGFSFPEQNMAELSKIFRRRKAAMQ